jgi:nucleoside-diphosphate-sugar epimerase
LDVSKARDLVGFQAEVELEDGIERTVRWYREFGMAAAAGA